MESHGTRIIVEQPPNNATGADKQLELLRTSRRSSCEHGGERGTRLKAAALFQEISDRS